MLRWVVIAAVLWLAVLTVLTLIALFRHSSSQHTGRPALVLRE
jgi:hypothetical protein